MALKKRLLDVASRRRGKLGRTIGMTALLPLLLLRLAAGQTADAQTTTQQTAYTVTDLGTLGGTFSLATGLTNAGWVSGTSNLPGDTAQHAFLWRPGLMTDLGTLGGANSAVLFPLNERGEVTGFAETSTPDPLGEDFCSFGMHLTCLPFIWKHGVMTPLPTLGGNNGEAGEINNRGQVAGLAENTTPDPTCPAPYVLQFKPVLWENGQIRELPTLPGDPDGVALAINDNGQVVNSSGTCESPFSHPFLWEKGTVTALSSLGGTMDNIPEDINNQGQVVGQSDLPGDTTFHAFLWQKGIMTDLGTLQGDVSSAAVGINSKGQVVGASFDASMNPRAFLWQNDVMTDLNTLIPAGSPLFLLYASGYINSREQIAGFALQISTGEIHAFLATPDNAQAASASVTTAARGQSPKVVMPESVRELLRQRLGHWHGIPR